MNRRLVILGSGELAPPMVKTYRSLFEGLDSRKGVYLNSPYGFQENVPQLSEKIEQYFSTSLQWNFEQASLTHHEVDDLRHRAAFLNTVDEASVVFAGPGSPTYALRQFAAVDLGTTLRQRIEAGTLVCFSSAAALTLGSHTAPIYEIYKVGEEPSWREGLNVLDLFGLSCAVIPHYDNAEGGNHDTRFCYLGASRLVALENLLPTGTAILGVDEHTAAIFSLDNDTVTVEGRGHAYWRVNGVETQLDNGTTTPLSNLRGAAPTNVVTTTPVAHDHESDDLFTVILRGGDLGARALEKLMEQAAQGAPGRIDPATLVSRLLEIRASARAEGHYGIADQIRDALTASDIEIHDGPNGSTWQLRNTD